MDCFSPTFTKLFLLENKKSKKHENFKFLLVGFTYFLSSRVFLSAIKMGGNLVCTLFILTGKHEWSIS